MITSEQIHEKEFTFKIRGYNDAEVDAYLDQLAAYIDNLSKENKELRERLKNTTDQLTYMKNLETTLRDTLVTAQRSAEETTRAASLRSEEILAAANAESARIVAQANVEADQVRRQLTGLRQQAAVYRQNFKMLLNSQMQLLEDTGFGKERMDEPVAPAPAPTAAATSLRGSGLSRINLAEDLQMERRERDPMATRKIVPIPQEDE